MVPADQGGSDRRGAAAMLDQESPSCLGFREYPATNLHGFVAQSIAQCGCRASLEDAVARRVVGIDDSNGVSRQVVEQAALGAQIGLGRGMVIHVVVRQVREHGG